MTQGDRTFKKFMCHLGAANTCLIATPKKTQTDYKLWKEQVHCIDDLLIQMYTRSCNANRATTPAAELARKNNMSNTSSSKSTNTNGRTKPPLLTAKENVLLIKYHGCFKCLRLDQKHQSRDCPNDFHSGVGYCELTLSDVPSGYKPEPERKTVATMTLAHSESPQCSRHTSLPQHS
ncbi:hypothetical protein FIBSPDRAFT_886013 [Athelia psychrophila]|uniref:Uncharacterized protein n=1 Tax=Athelia psychrophila TaxID=1759441 RepID=A0A166RCP7_9AGAM|nr:hypothetical protein FIBSPDRAFT_886013 [Fibularhizoctonia sp. CBS 109695]